MGESSQMLLLCSYYGNLHIFFKFQRIGRSPILFMVTNSFVYVYVGQMQRRGGTRRLQGALGTLDGRSRDILQKRWLADDKATLQDLANHYKVSAERIRQLERAVA